MQQPAIDRPSDDAAGTVLRFLKALENRDLEAAKAMLAPDIEMVFPGGAVFTDLSELIDWARPRYQRVAKTVERVDTAAAEDGTVVFCQGTLHGVWPDGTPFDGIRFADWFLIRDGLIVRQQVWNDLAEVTRGPG